MRSARRFLCFLALILVLMVPISAHAQQWSGIIAPSRAANWSTAGVVGDIPSGSWANCVTSACNTLFGGTVTGTSINSAITSAPNNTVVRVPAGTFTISDNCINLTRSNVALRGAGADQTKLSFNASCTGGGLGSPRSINLMSGSAGIGAGTTVGGTNPDNQVIWSAGYAQGATSITLSGVSGLTAGAAGLGSIIFLDQLDDVAGVGFPTVNDVIQCSVAGVWCSNKGDGNHWGRPGRSMIQAVTVTAISGSGPFTVSISPGVAFPTVRSSQIPGAWWNNTQIHNSGIENMTLDFTNAGGTYGTFIKDGSNLWLVGNRIVNTASDTGAFYTNWVMNSAHVTMRSNYIYGKNTTCNPFPLENYGITTKEVSDSLFENNIFHHTNNAYVPNDPGDRNVFSYNWVVGSVVGGGGAQPHSGMIGMDLYEGNDWQSYYGDVTHGTHMFLTFYRNLFDGTANNNSCTVGQALTLMTNNRFNNAVANVFGSSSYSQYEDNVNNTGGAPNALYVLGWIGNNSGTAVNADSNVKRTLLRWGNWDQFTSTNDTGTNDLTGVRWDSSEVPSGITNFPNPVPANQNLPASFYLSSKPSWFGSAPFPAIGPDVSNGNAPNTSSTPTGGHANKIPSRRCFEGLTNDSAYGSLSIKSFNATTCYGGGTSGTQVVPPTGLQAVVQ